MYKKTIQTIRQRPKMLWGFAIPVIIGLGLAFPIYRSIILTILGDYSRIDDMPNFQLMLRSIVIATPFAYILMGVFILPPLYAYVYSAISGRKWKMLSKHGFLKYSWRIVAKTFLNFFILFGLFVVLFLFFAVPNLGFILYTIAFSAWGVFWTISLTSAMVEDRFIDSLPNTFFVGRRYYFKMYFTSTVVTMPAIIFSVWFLIYFHGVGLDIAHAVPTLSLNPYLIVAMFIGIILFLSIYYVFAQAFLFTYSMHHYITQRELMYKEDENNEKLKMMNGK